MELIVLAPLLKAPDSYWIYFFFLFLRHGAVIRKLTLSFLLLFNSVHVWLHCFYRWLSVLFLLSPSLPVSVVQGRITRMFCNLSCCTF